MAEKTSLSDGLDERERVRGCGKEKAMLHFFGHTRIAQVASRGMEFPKQPLYQIFWYTEFALEVHVAMVQLDS